MFVQILSLLPKIKVTINVFLATSCHLGVHRLLQKVFPLGYVWIFWVTWIQQILSVREDAGAKRTFQDPLVLKITLHVVLQYASFIFLWTCIFHCSVHIINIKWDYFRWLLLRNRLNDTNKFWSKQYHYNLCSVCHLGSMYRHHVRTRVVFGSEEIST